MIRPVGHTVLEIPTFEEGCLRYRAPRREDFDTYAAFRMSDRAKGVGGPYNLSDSFDSFLELTGHWQMRGYGRWMIADLETDAPLGVVGPFFPIDWPEPEIAWSLFAGAEGRGLAFEAAQFCRRYAYDVLGWSTAISCTMPDNTRSIALAKRMGATQEADFQHPEIGPLNVWRHPGPEARA